MQEEIEALKKLAADARMRAGNAENSEYPHTERSVNNELADDIERLAAVLGEPPPGKTGNRREDRQAMRAFVLKRKAARVQVEASRLHTESSKLAGVVPFGQPILVGHHSERKHRRLLERVHAKTRKGFEMHKLAEEYERRAEAAANNRAIFRDDANALTKLTLKQQGLERERDAIKLWNAATRKKGATWESCSQAWGVPVEDARRATRYSYRKVEGKDPPLPYPAYNLTNLGAEIRRCSARIEDIKRVRASADKAEATGPEEIAPGVKVNVNRELLKLEVWFPGKPSDQIRTFLKRHGFRWIRSVGCWSRNYGNDAVYWVKQLKDLLVPAAPEVPATPESAQTAA